MLTSTKHHLLNNLSLSLISLIFGYALWQSMSQPYAITAEFSVPLSFYNNTAETLNAPETVVVTLKGTRKELYKLAPNLATHINTHVLQSGENTVKITHNNLFLPDSVQLLHCVPSAITVTKI